MYYEILAKMKNAVRAKKEVFFVPYSKMDFEVLRILAEAKYVKEIQKKMVGKQCYLEIKLPLGDSRHTMTDFTIVSKPSRHLYTGYRALGGVKQGYGLGVLSTSQGLMTHREAKKQKVGGEYLFKVW